MKKAILCVLLGGLMPSQLRAQQASPSPAAPVSGSTVFLGTRALDNDGWAGRLNEYEANKSGARPAFSANYWLSQGSTFVDISLENRGDGRAQSHSLDADIARRVRVRTTVERFLHRLDHDPMLNLDTAKGNVVVRNDNLAPDRALVPGRNEIRTDLDGYITSWLRWRASHRFLQRHGDIQTRSISKCANCHITGEATRIDQRRQQLSGGLTARLNGKVSLHYDFTSAQFREHGQRPTNIFDTAQHPASLSRAFFNRVLYDGTTNGALPYAYVPGFRKTSHDLKLTADLPADSRLTAQLLHTSARNTHVNTDLDVLAWGGRYVLPIGKKATFKAQFRKADMHSDDVFVQLEELANPAGVPQAGVTYPQAYPTFGSLDWVRGSSINRVDVVASGELSYRLARLTTVRGGYQFRSIRRENFDVERTDRNRLFALFNSRSSNTWKARVRYTFDQIDRPFLHHKAALSPALQPDPSPGNPPSPLAGTQYFTLYAARQADLTNQPTRGQYLEPSFTWTPNIRTALTLHYRMRLERNDKLNYGTWSRDIHMPGVELWFAPLERLNLTLAYQTQRETSHTLYVIPAFDG